MPIKDKEKAREYLKTYLANLLAKQRRSLVEILISDLLGESQYSQLSK